MFSVSVLPTMKLLFCATIGSPAGKTARYRTRKEGNRGSNSDHACVCKSGGSGQFHQSGRLTSPAQGHRHQTDPAPGGAAAREAAAPHDTPRECHPRWSRVLRAGGPPAQRPGRAGGEYGQRADQPARAAAGGCGLVGGQPADHPSALNLLRPLPRHPAGHGCE